MVTKRKTTPKLTQSKAAPKLFGNKAQIVDKEYILNYDEKMFIQESVQNVITSRSQIMQQWFDPRRSIDKECGYPATTNISDDLYKKMYRRDPIAGRVVEVFPKECWQDQPTIFEAESSEDVTAFEKAWDQLGNSLRGESWYKEEKSNPVWEYLCRADVLSGIGTFGIILLGIDDNKRLEEPIQGFGNPRFERVWNGEYKNKRKKVKKFSLVDNVKLEAKKKVKSSDPVAQSILDEEDDTEVKTERKLLYLRTFDESLVDIVQYDADQQSPRYGQPTMYNVTLNDPMDQHSGIGLPLATMRVHWSRIIHLADNLNSSEIFGTPRMQVVWNRLLDLQKLYGGSAEMYWRGAFPGLSFETHPSMADDAIGRVNLAAARSAYEKYANNLQRAIFSEGMTVKTLSPQVVDPTAQIKILINAICVYLGIPERIFMGSERGELSSTQDTDTWFYRVDFRRKMYLTPRVIIPFVDRLIKIGVLPEPEDSYYVVWPESKLTLSQKIAIAVQMMDAISKYIGAGGDAIFSPLDLLVRLLGFSEIEGKAILEAVAEFQKEANPDVDPNTIVPGKQVLPEVEDDPMLVKPGEAMVKKSGDKVFHNPALPKAGDTSKKGTRGKQSASKTQGKVKKPTKRSKDAKVAPRKAVSKTTSKVKG